MRIRMIMIAAGALAASSAASAPPVPAHAGPHAHVLPASACAAPVEPSLKLDPSLKGRAAMRAHNDAVRAYNAHVEAVNAYLKCIADETARDLDAYYSMVSAAHDAKQSAALDRLEALRAELKLPAR